MANLFASLNSVKASIPPITTSSIEKEPSDAGDFFQVGKKKRTRGKPTRAQSQPQSYNDKRSSSSSRNGSHDPKPSYPPADSYETQTWKCRRDIRNKTQRPFERKTIVVDEIDRKTRTRHRVERPLTPEEVETEKRYCDRVEKDRRVQFIEAIDLIAREPQNRDNFLQEHVRLFRAALNEQVVAAIIIEHCFEMFDPRRATDTDQFWDNIFIIFAKFEPTPQMFTGKLYAPIDVVTWNPCISLSKYEQVVSFFFEYRYTDDQLGQKKRFKFTSDNKESEHRFGSLLCGLARNNVDFAKHFTEEFVISRAKIITKYLDWPTHVVYWVEQLVNKIQTVSEDSHEILDKPVKGMNDVELEMYKNAVARAAKALVAEKKNKEDFLFCFLFSPVRTLEKIVDKLFSTMSHQDGVNKIIHDCFLIIGLFERAIRSNDSSVCFELESPIYKDCIPRMIDEYKRGNPPPMEILQEILSRKLDARRSRIDATPATNISTTTTFAQICAELVGYGYTRLFDDILTGKNMLWKSDQRVYFEATDYPLVVRKMFFHYPKNLVTHDVIHFIVSIFLSSTDPKLYAFGLVIKDHLQFEYDQSDTDPISQQAKDVSDGIIDALRFDSSDTTISELVEEFQEYEDPVKNRIKTFLSLYRKDDIVQSIQVFMTRI